MDELRFNDSLKHLQTVVGIFVKVVDGSATDGDSHLIEKHILNPVIRDQLELRHIYSVYFNLDTVLNGPCHSFGGTRLHTVCHFRLQESVLGTPSQFLKYKIKLVYSRTAHNFGIQCQTGLMKKSLVIKTVGLPGQKSKIYLKPLFMKSTACR
jgi:hypothetical protein